MVIMKSKSLSIIKIAFAKARCIRCQGIGLVDLEFGSIADCPECYGMGKKYYSGRLMICINPNFNP
jgi:excinuclease UvrABC ATPase subunit